jgi:hypothetical protein
MTIRINEACTEFGRTFTQAQVVQDLSGLEQLAMVLSEFAVWIGADGNPNRHSVSESQPDVSLTTPITSRQFAQPARYGIPSWYVARTSLEPGPRRYLHNGVTYSFANDSFVPL